MNKYKASQIDDYLNLFKELIFKQNIKKIILKYNSLI